MHLFHHFLMVEIMFSEAYFGAESGISQHNGPIISGLNTSLGRNGLYHQATSPTLQIGKSAFFLRNEKKWLLTDGTCRRVIDTASLLLDAAFSYKK